MIRYLPILAATVIGALGAGAVLFVVFEKQKREQRSELKANEKEITGRLKEKLGDSDTDAAVLKATIRKLNQQLQDNGNVASSNPNAKDIDAPRVENDPDKVIVLLSELDVEDDYAEPGHLHGAGIAELLHEGGRYFFAEPGLQTRQ